MVVIVMGVSGSGKTTVGRALAERVGWDFCDADDVHTAASIAKMARGEPLTDEDRWPWLEQMRARVAAALDAGRGLVLTCSALKAAYRRFLRVDTARVLFAYLAASPALAEERLRQRQGHFMKASMAGSQFATLEEPPAEEALRLDAA